MKPLLKKAFRTLRETGFGLVDVGSRDGLHPMFKEAASLVEAVGFEPDLEECHRLNRETNGATTYRSLKVSPFALGRVDGERMLYICRSRGTSSLYKPNRSFLNRFPDSERFDVESERRVAVRSLDSIVGDPSVPLPPSIDFMKIDTQGSELEILQGARATLGRQVIGVEVEAEFTRLYESQPLFRDVDAYLSECGFTLFKLRRLEWVREAFRYKPHLTSGQLVFADVLYLKDPFGGEQAWFPQNAHQTEALVLLSMLYDLHDFALEIVSAPWAAEMLDVDAVRGYILQRSRRLNRPWRRRARGVVNLLRLFFGAGEIPMRRFNVYQAHWGRGDCNFYSMLG